MVAPQRRTPIAAAGAPYCVGVLSLRPKRHHRVNAPPCGRTTVFVALMVALIASSSFWSHTAAGAAGTALRTDQAVAADDPPGARDKAEEILEEPRFQPPDNAPENSQTPAQDKMNDFTPGGGGGAGGGTGDGNGGGGSENPPSTDNVIDPINPPSKSSWGPVLLIAVVLLIAFILWMVLRNRARTRQPATDDGGGLMGQEDDLWAEADRLAAQGNYSEALRVRFKGGLMRLGKTRNIDYRPAISSGEAQSMYPDRVFAELANSHAQVAYGDRPTTAEEYTRVRDAWMQTTGAKRQTSAAQSAGPASQAGFGGADRSA